MLVYSSSLLPVVACDLDLLVFVSLSGILGCLCVLPMVVVSNRYTSIGCLRHLRALIVADIGLDTSLVVLLFLFVTLDSGSNSMTASSCTVLFLIALIPVFVLMLIASARAPFDLPEAESELVSGSLTEVGGTAFSLCLLLDYLEILT
jgi:NADH:ubiquinone oxidoreductase subunit H